jgi:hypothetical protein
MKDAVWTCVTGTGVGSCDRHKLQGA